MLDWYGIATTVGYGPRFLHSTGQLHKGGPDSGLFLQLTQEHAEDVPIPGKPYTFGVLADAQSRGDYQALNKAGRRTARVHLAGDAVAGITVVDRAVEGVTVRQASIASNVSPKVPRNLMFSGPSGPGSRFSIRRSMR